MEQTYHADADELNEAEESRIREAALDETIAETFPASDPLSSDPNPAARDDFHRLAGIDREWLSET